MKSLLLALPALAAALPQLVTKTTSSAPPYASIKSVTYGGTGELIFTLRSALSMSFGPPS
jgi:hypothetical protein